eukprot:344240-Prorocentrum_minimum.AAC.1
MLPSVVLAVSAKSCPSGEGPSGGRNQPPGEIEIEIEIKIEIEIEIAAKKTKGEGGEVHRVGQIRLRLPAETEIAIKD